MSKEILYILLPDYAAHEVVYLSQAVASDEHALKENPEVHQQDSSSVYGTRQIHRRFPNIA